MTEHTQTKTEKTKSGAYVKTTTTTTRETLPDIKIQGGDEMVVNGQLYIIDNVRRSFGELTISGTSRTNEDTTTETIK